MPKATSEANTPSGVMKLKAINLSINYVGNVCLDADVPEEMMAVELWAQLERVLHNDPDTQSFTLTATCDRGN